MAEDKKLTIQQLLNTLDPERLTKEDFVKSFENVVIQIKKIEKRNEETIAQLTKAFEDVSKKLKDDNSLDLFDVKKEIAKQLKKALDDQSVSLNFVRDKVSKLKSGNDGLDADETVIVEKVLSQIKLPEQKEMILDTPDEVIEKVNKADTKIKKEQVEGIDEAFKEMDVKVSSARGFAARSSNSTKFEPLTADGSTKIFAVPKSVASILFSSDFPNVLYENNGFTINATRTQITITTENAPSDGSQLIYQFSSVFN